MARSTGAAPRQRGRSDGWTFSQSARSKQRGGDQEAVGADDDGIELAGGQLGTGRLLDLDPEPLGRLLGRRRGELAAAAAQRVGAREQEGDLVARCEAGEHVRTERGRRGDGDAHLPQDCLWPQDRHGPLRLSSSVRSMISTPSRWSILVLHGACGKTFELEANLAARRVDAFERDA